MMYDSVPDENVDYVHLEWRVARLEQVVVKSLSVDEEVLKFLSAATRTSAASRQQCTLLDAEPSKTNRAYTAGSCWHFPFGSSMA
jgi:hypothetical protein